MALWYGLGDRDQEVVMRHLQPYAWTASLPKDSALSFSLHKATCLLKRDLAAWWSLVTNSRIRPARDKSGVTSLAGLDAFHMQNRIYLPGPAQVVCAHPNLETQRPL